MAAYSLTGSTSKKGGYRMLRGGGWESPSQLVFEAQTYFEMVAEPP
jgi:hypothetical protein